MKLQQFIREHKEGAVARPVLVSIHVDDLDYEVEEDWILEHGDPFEGKKTAEVFLSDTRKEGDEIRGVATWNLDGDPVTEFGIKSDGKIWFSWGDGEEPDED